MSIFEVIVNHFNEDIDVTSRHIESLTPYIAEAAHLIHQTVLDDGKIYCATAPNAYAAGKQFCQLMSHSANFDRPALPAISLADICQGSGTASSPDNLSRQITALGQKSDLLIAISSAGNETELLACIESAHDREMPVIALSAGQASDVNQALLSSDVLMSTPGLNPLQTAQLQFLIIQVFADLLEQLLFGDIAL